jgi:hypothetical protein
MTACRMFCDRKFDTKFCGTGIRIFFCVLFLISESFVNSIQNAKPCLLPQTAGTILNTTSQLLTVRRTLRKAVRVRTGSSLVNALISCGSHFGTPVSLSLPFLQNSVSLTAPLWSLFLLCTKWSVGVKNSARSIRQCVPPLFVVYDQKHAAWNVLRPSQFMRQCCISYTVTSAVHAYDVTVGHGTCNATLTTLLLPPHPPIRHM